MDPQAAINTMSECANDQDWISLSESADDMMTWLVNGGFTTVAMAMQLRDILDRIPVEQTSTREYVKACITIIL